MPTYKIEYDPKYPKHPYWVHKDGWLMSGECSASSLEKAKKLIRNDVDLPPKRIVYEVTYD